MSIEQELLPLLAHRNMVLADLIPRSELPGHGKILSQPGFLLIAAFEGRFDSFYSDQDLLLLLQEIQRSSTFDAFYTLSKLKSCLCTRKTTRDNAQRDLSLSEPLLSAETLQASNVASLNNFMSDMSESPNEDMMLVWASVLKVPIDAVNAYVRIHFILPAPPSISPTFSSSLLKPRTGKIPDLAKEHCWPIRPGDFAPNYSRQQSLTELMAGMYVETVTHSLIPDVSDNFRVRSHERRERSRRILSEDISATGYMSFDHPTDRTHS